MVIVIELPHVGESVTEGVIGKWLVKPGQKIDRYDPLVEVITDKVSMEVPSPYQGIFLRPLAAEGATVQMGHPVCEMEIQSATVEPVDVHQPTIGETSPSVAESGRTFEFMDSVRSVGPTGSGEGGAGRPDAVRDAVSTAKPPALRTARPKSNRSHVISPLVAKLAEQRAVDLGTIVGTGAGGRVTKQDVINADSMATATDHGGEELPASSPPSTTTISVTTIRKTIAEHMAQSSREIPAAWSMVEVDVSGLVRARAIMRPDFERAHAIPLTYLPFVARSVAKALRDNPRINARWGGDHIKLNNQVNLGIAVSTEKGLIVPVVHDAGALSVTALAVAIQKLIESARLGSLRIEQVRDGTFTLNNTGALGSVASMPIINSPEAAIMTTETIVKRPVVVEGDAIAVRSMMNVCLTFDHRICDGAEASVFLQSVKTSLEAIDERMSLD